MPLMMEVLHLFLTTANVMFEKACLVTTMLKTEEVLFM
jgi:hypothetical protein